MPQTTAHHPRALDTGLDYDWAVRQPLRKCAVCGSGAEEQCPRCGRPLCSEDAPPEHLRCRFCEREYWRRLYSGRVVALFILVTALPIAVGLVLLGLGLWFDGAALLILGPVGAAAVRAFAVGKRSSLRAAFLSETSPRALGSAPDPE